MTNLEMNQIREKLKTAKSIRALWDVYLYSLIPPGASAAQITETRRAFYAGADGLLRLILQNLETTATDDATGADLAFMDRIEKELQDFKGQIARGAA